MTITGKSLELQSKMLSIQKNESIYFTFSLGNIIKDKNNSFFKIKYCDISNDAFDSILTSDRIEDEQMTKLSMFDSKTIPCYILVNEDMTVNDLKQVIENSKIKIFKHVGNNVSNCDLSVDDVLFE